MYSGGLGVPADSSSWLTSPVKSCSTAGDLELPPVDLWFHGGTTLKLQHLKLVSSTEYKGAGSNFKFCFNLKARRWCDISMLAGLSVRANSAQWERFGFLQGWLSMAGCSLNSDPLCVDECCQLDRIYHHLRDKSLGMSMSFW